MIQMTRNEKKTRPKAEKPEKAFVKAEVKEKLKEEKEEEVEKPRIKREPELEGGEHQLRVQIQALQNQLLAFKKAHHQEKSERERLTKELQLAEDKMDVMVGQLRNEAQRSEDMASRLPL